MSGENPSSPELSRAGEAILTLTDAPAGTIDAVAGATKKLLNGQPYIYDDLKEGYTFSDVLAWIDAHYDFHYVPFSVGELKNSDPAKTTGSCKVLAYAKLLGAKLSQVGALELFAEHYKNVKETPNDTNHPNIRALMKSGIEGVSFEGEDFPLQPKK